MGKACGGWVEFMDGLGEEPPMPLETRGPLKLPP